MKRLIYQVYVGKRSKLYDHCTQSVKDYCKRHNIDYEVQRSPILMIKPDVFSTNRSKESYEKHGGYLPIYEKENAFTYLRSYDQVAIIDADVWIRPDAPNIFDELSEGYDFGAVCERELTTKLPGPVNVATLQSPTVVNVLHAPVTEACRKGLPVTLEVESIVFFQPSVAST